MRRCLVQLTGPLPDATVSGSLFWYFHTYKGIHFIVYKPTSLMTLGYTRKLKKRSHFFMVQSSFEIHARFVLAHTSSGLLKNTSYCMDFKIFTSK